MSTTDTMRDAFVPEVPDALHEAAERLYASTASDALANLRSDAWETFAAVGLPGTGNEDFSFVSQAEVKAALKRIPGEAPEPRVEGTGFETASFEEYDIRVGGKDAPAALACTFARHPVILRVAPGVKADIRLTLPASGAPTGRADHAVVLDLEDNAEADVSLSTEGLGPDGVLNAMVAVSVGPGARVRLVQRDAREGVQFLKIRLTQERDSRAELLSVTTGSKLSRLAIEAELFGPGAELDLRGAAALSGTDRAHRHIRVRHAAPDCVSRQLFKAVVDGAARSSLDGTVVVDPGAQRTDARQLLQHRLLSSEARGDAKPRLLIHADDVKCSHGATAGKTDPAQLFYLRSRGLDARAANALLTRAFLGEALGLLPTAAGRESAWKFLSPSLSAGATA